MSNKQPEILTAPGVGERTITPRLKRKYEAVRKMLVFNKFYILGNLVVFVTRTHRFTMTDYEYYKQVLKTYRLRLLYFESEVINNALYMKLITAPFEIKKQFAEKEMEKRILELCMLW